MVIDMLKGKNKAGVQLLTKDTEASRELGYVPVSSLGIEVDAVSDMLVHPDAIPAINSVFQDRRRGKFFSVIELINGIAKKLNL